MSNTILIQLSLGTLAKTCTWLNKAPTCCKTFLEILVDSEWGAGAKALRTAALSLIYSTAEYCAPAWCRSAHTRLIDSVLNDALRITTGCLRPTPTDNLPVFSRIQSAELRHQEGTLSLDNCSSLDPGHVLHGLLTESQAASKERLKSRHPFVSTACITYLSWVYALPNGRT